MRHRSQHDEEIIGYDNQCSIRREYGVAYVLLERPFERTVMYLTLAAMAH
jgi:hypothetical protein